MKSIGIVFFILILCITTGCDKDKTEYPTAYETSPSPTISQLHLPESPGKQVIRDSRNLVEVDYSNTTQGYIQAKLLQSSEKRVRIGITKDGKGNLPYDFDLQKVGKSNTFLLDQGSGTYILKIYLNTANDSYAVLLTQSIEVQLENEQIPYLYPNQVVDYDENSKAIKKAFELTKNDDTKLKRIATLYNYVVNNVTYDDEKAKEVDDIYVLPVIDTTLSSKKGICFDYAALLTAMLRSQQIPTRLITGNTSIEYHAWIEVYIEGEGWINPDVLLKAKKWSRMDPTFASSKTEYKDDYEDKYYY